MDIFHKQKNKKKLKPNVFNEVEYLIKRKLNASIRLKNRRIEFNR